MSQESQKFPLRLIFPTFCESHQHESPPVGTGARKLKRRPLAESRIEGRHLLRQFIQRTAALEIFGLQRCGLNNADQGSMGFFAFCNGLTHFSKANVLAAFRIPNLGVLAAISTDIRMN